MDCTSISRGYFTKSIVINQYEKRDIQTGSRSSYLGRDNCRNGNYFYAVGGEVMAEIKIMVREECKEEAIAVLEFISGLDRTDLRDLKNQLIGAMRVKGQQSA